MTPENPHLERGDAVSPTLENCIIWFVCDWKEASGAVESVRAEVCCATLLDRMNTPYAADETYCFSVELDLASDEMLVWVNQEYFEVATDGKRSDTLLLYRATDPLGRAWAPEPITDARRQQMKWKRIFVAENYVPEGFRL